MPPKAPSRTRVEDVYLAIKDDICMGRMEPGQRINLGDVCKAHGVSLTVVREAVTRLASERLIQATPQQGFSVWPLSVPDLLDLTRVRIDIESMAVRESILEGDLNWEADLVAAHHRLLGATRGTDENPAHPNYPWMKAHSEFHAALAAACTSPLLRQLRQQLFDASELYRFWSATIATSSKPRPVSKEHLGLLEAALAHDADEGVARLTAHIQRTTDRIVAAQVSSADAPARSAG